VLCTEKKRLLDLIIAHNPLKPVELETAAGGDDRGLASVQDYSPPVAVRGAPAPRAAAEEGTLRRGRGRCAGSGSGSVSGGLALPRSGTRFQTAVRAGGSSRLVKSDELLLLGYCALGKELLLGLDPAPAWWAARAVWSQPCPGSCSHCLIPRCPARLLSGPVMFVINCFLLRSVYVTLFSTRIAWSWGSPIVSCRLILMFPNTAAAP